MATSMQYMEQALALGQRELAALTQGDVDEAAELAERREALAAQAWEARAMADKEGYGEQIIQMLHLQEVLRDAAQNLREDIREGLVQSRKENKRLAGYRQAVAHAL